MPLDYEDAAYLGLDPSSSSSTIGNINALREAIGPKRVKTPLIEVEQFDLNQLDKIAQKSNSFKPMFSNFMFSKAVPKCGTSCETGTCCDPNNEH